jgi:hypothetical protein
MDQVRVITDDLAIGDKPAGPLRGYIGSACIWAQLDTRDVPQRVSGGHRDGTRLGMIL